VLVLRTPLQNILGTLTRFRYGEIEIDFGQEIKVLEDEARNAGLSVQRNQVRSQIEPKGSSQTIVDANKLATDFPGPAVGLAWTAVEQELLQAIMRLKISADYPPNNSPVKNINLLHEQNYLDSDSRGLLDRMRRLRNNSVHSGHATERWFGKTEQLG
jgi:hypothetical protein